MKHGDQQKKAVGGDQAALNTSNYNSNVATSYKTIQGGLLTGISIPTGSGSLHTNGHSPITIGITDVNGGIEEGIVVGIDKLELINTLPSCHYSMMLTEFEQVPECYGGKYKKTTKYNKNGSKYYIHSCKIPLGDGNHLQMRIGKHNGGKYYLKVIFNPSRMTKRAWGKFCGYLETILENGYHELVSTFRVNYIEIYADVKGVKFEGILPLDICVRNYCDDYLSRGTIYLGVRKGGREIAVYDKKKQLFRRRKIHLPYDLTRIEARLCPKNLTLLDLISLPNPFAPLIVAQYAGYEELATNKGDGKIIKSVLGLRGWLNARSKLYLAYYILLTSPYKYKKIPEALSTISCVWWNPDKIWAMGLEAIKALAPSNVAACYSS